MSGSRVSAGGSGGGTESSPSSDEPVAVWPAARLVARREFTERIRDRGFVGSAVVMIVILLLAAVLPSLFGGKDSDYDVSVLGPQRQQVERAAEAQSGLLDVTVRLRPAADRAAAEAALRDGSLDALVDTSVAGGSVVVHRDLDDRLAAVLQSAWAGVQRDQRLAAQGVDPSAVETALAVSPMNRQTLDPHADQRDQRRGVALVGTLLLYGMLILFCSWVANGIVEEKSSRVVEILLSTVPSRALLAGKIIGIGLLGLLQMLVIAVLGLGAASATGTVELNSSMVYPAALVLVWFVLGYAVFSCMFAAAAARVSRQEDLQNVLGPATSLLVASFMVALITANSGGSVARVLAYVPPFSAMLQPILTASGDLAGWQNGVAALITVAAVAALVTVAARLYEGSVLRMGAKVSVKDAWRR